MRYAISRHHQKLLGYDSKARQKPSSSFKVLQSVPAILLFLLFQTTEALCGSVSISSQAASNLIAVTQAGAVTPKQRWNLATTVEAYRRVGHRDAKWDAAAIEALEIFAVTRGLKWSDQVEKVQPIIGQQSRAALSQGCQDPLIRHLAMRFFNTSQGERALGMQDDQYKVALKLLNSDYPAVRKFNACVLLIESYASEGRDGGNFPTLFEYATKFLNTCFEDSDIPNEEMFLLGDSYMRACESAKQDFQQAWGNIESSVNDRLGRTHYAALTKGAAYVRGAWQARGHAFAHRVPEEGWRLMARRLAVARQFLEKAWEMDTSQSYVPNLMMEVALLEGNDSTEVVTWFNRGMTVDRDNYEACGQLLNALTPRWGGSPEKVIAFGRQCLTNQSWGGKIPYLVTTAHFEIVGGLSVEERPAYFARNDVWLDVKTAFEELLKRFPHNAKYRREYFEWAFRCQRAEEMKALKEKLNTESQKPVRSAYRQ